MDNELFLPSYGFGYLEDGHIDVWFKRDPLFKPRVRKEFLNAIEDSGYTYDLVKKRDAELTIREVDVIDLDNPNVQGRFTSVGDTADVQVNLRRETSKGWKRFNRYLSSHEIGHALGLAHQFDTPITNTVMNYPTFDEIYSGRAANRLTKSDLFNIRNFTNQITNGYDDSITGQHYCGAGCFHQTFD